MLVQPLAIPDVLLIEPDRYEDSRGSFCETWNAPRWAAHGLPEIFPQDNYSYSRLSHTLRGLHMQPEMGKLVRVISGEIWDVAVDARRDSPTFGKWVGALLSADSWLQLWIPPGFFHGILTLRAHTEVAYKCSAIYRQEAELGLRWDDPSIGINWFGAIPTISEKDRELRSWEDYVGLVG